MDGDGCDSKCHIELGFVCKGAMLSRSFCWVEFRMYLRNVTKKPFANEITFAVRIVPNY